MARVRFPVPASYVGSFVGSLLCSKRIDKTRTVSITPDNIIEFCAFLSCVVVSSFIETRQNVFLPKVITDSEAEL